MSRFKRSLIAGFFSAAIIASTLFGITTQASAQYYYESRPQHYYEDDVYAQPRRRSYQQQPQGYYQQQPQGYYQQPQQPQGYYQQPRGYQQPQYYDKDAAKEYWRAQKEAQKRAIKGGYYNQ